MQRTPKSALVHAGFTPGEGRPDAPADLPKEEKAIWNQTVNAMPPGWFGDETLPLLRAYCVHAAMHELITLQIAQAVKALRGDLLDTPVGLDRLMRLQALQARSMSGMALKLRLAHQNRESKREAEVTKNNATRGVRPWMG